MKLISLLLISLLASCTRPLTREQAVATAYRYTQTQWMPSAQNVRHGPDSRGIIVHTPDLGLTKFCSCGLPKTLLIQQGYSPWRYRKFTRQNSVTSS